MNGHINQSIAIVVCVLAAYLTTQSNAQHTGHFLPSTVPSTRFASRSPISDVTISRSIEGGSFFQSSIEQIDKSLPPKEAASKITFGSLLSSEAKPFAFVIPSYASGIIENSTSISPNLLVPSTDLLPPFESINIALNQGAIEPTKTSSNNANTVNRDGPTISPSTPALVPESTVPGFSTQVFTSPSIPIITTQKPNVPTQSREFSTTPHHNEASTNPTVPFVPRFNFVPTTEIQPSVETTRSPASIRPNVKTTQLPSLGNNNRRLEILGFQSPGYAVRPDGSIDSNAVPHQQFQFNAPIVDFATSQPRTPQTFELSAKVGNVEGATAKLIRTTEKPITTQEVNNSTNNPWLLSEPTQKPFVPHRTNPFLPLNTFASATNAPDASNVDSTTEPLTKPNASGTHTIKGIVSFTNGTPTKVGFQASPNVPTNSNSQNQLLSAQRPLNFPSANRNLATPNFSQSTNVANHISNGPSLNGANGNLVNQSISRQPNVQSNQAPFVILLPDENLLPPFESTKPPTTHLTTPEKPTTFNPTTRFAPTFRPTTQFVNTVGTTKYATPLPTTIFASTFPTTNIPTTFPTTLSPTKVFTTNPPIQKTVTNTNIPTTFSPTTIDTTIVPISTTTRKHFNQPSLIALKPSLDLLPPLLNKPASPLAPTQITSRSAVGVTESITSKPSIALPFLDLLPPLNFNLTDPISVPLNLSTTEQNQFLPQLDLNPFLPPILAAPTTGNDAAFKQPSQHSNHQATVPLNANQPDSKENTVSLSSTEFDIPRPSKPFVIGNSAKPPHNEKSANASPQSQQSPASTKYTGGFGAPPGILTPYDNIRG